MADIKNLKKVKERIARAVKKKENIILYGDADLDGVTSVIVLKETISNLGGRISSVYFPDREIEGYGITETGLNYLKKFPPVLLIALDLGIGNFKETKLAEKKGFEVIIIDHHEVLDRLPEASIIVDPKQKGDKYPFKDLATAGIVFKLSEITLGDKMTDSLRKNFIELTALATIADMMPKKEENKKFIEEGLSSLERSWRPGIKSFFETEPFKNFNNLHQKVSKIISILNIRDVKNNLPVSFRLLTVTSTKEAKKIIKNLLEKNEIRKNKIMQMIDEVETEISKKEDPIIFFGSSDWEYVLIGSVASIICQKYQKPCFLYKKLKSESQGTTRVPPGINSVCLMKKCSKRLLTFGGHPLASGFRIKNQNLEKFKDCLIKNLN